MPVTSQLGTADSRLGNIELGQAPAVNFNQHISEALTFSETLTSHLQAKDVTDTITFSDTLFRNIVAHLSISDTLSFTEAAASVKPVSTSDSVTFTDNASAVVYVVGAGSDTLTLAETATVQFLAGRVINEGLPFTELLARKMIRMLSISENITFTETMAGADVKVAHDLVTFADSLSVFVAKLLKDALDFDSIFHLNAIFRKPANDVFEMYDSILLNTYMRLPLTDTLVFTDTMAGVKVTPVSESVTFSEGITVTSSKLTTDTLSLVELLAVSKVKHVDISDSLNFSDSESVALTLYRTITEVLNLAEAYLAIRVKFAASTDSFSFTDAVYREVHVVTAPDTLSLTETLTCHKIAVGAPTDTVAFNEAIFVNTVISRTLTDTLAFQEKPPADYQPSSSIGIPDVPSGTYGTVADKMMVFIGQTKSVVITPPEFNDYIADRNQVIFKRKMDASVTTFIKTCKDEKLHYEFVVAKPKSDEFRAFLDAENGRAFTIYDWKGHIWVAKLLTDTIDKEEVGRWEPSGNKTRISVEFLGRRYA